MLTVVGLHGCLKGVKVVMNGGEAGYINLGRGCPDHYDAAAAVLLLEVADVLTHLLHQFPTGGFGVFYPCAFQGFHIVGVIYTFHGDDLLQFVLYRVDVTVSEHFSVHRAFKSIVGKNVPCTEYDVV